MAIRKWLEPPKAAMGHPIREAKLLLAASRAVARLAPGNGSAGRLSAQSRAGGNANHDMMDLAVFGTEDDPIVIED